MSDKNTKLVFVILIGGGSTRFGSDKGIFEFKGKPLILYQLETLRQFKRPIYISTKSSKQLQKYTDIIQDTEDLTFVLDKKEILKDSSVKTPMLGIYSTYRELCKLNIEKAFTFSCDTPLINPDVISLMIDFTKNNDYDFIIPRWENGFLEPLYAIYPVEATYHNAKKNLKKQYLKLLNLIDPTWTIKYISIEKTIKKYDENLRTFLNVNRKSDIKKLALYLEN